jgi:hypothetical protein
MFNLTSEVILGNYTMYGGFNEVKIKRSVKEIVDTATIKVPSIGRIKDNPGLPMSSIETSTCWTEGDEVTMLLGYNNDNRQEFKGFVRSVKPSIPVEIECEGYAWQLRRKYLPGYWKSIKLREFLTILIQGTAIKISPFVPDLPLTNLNIATCANCLEILEYLKKNCHLAVYFQFDTLYVGLEEAIPGDLVKYDIGWNVPRTNKLDYKVASDTKVSIQLVTGKGKNKKRTLIQKGDAGGSLIRENISNIVDQKSLTTIANQQLAHRKYDGLQGNLDAFMQPYCKPCDTAQLIDEIYNVVDGEYFVEGVEITFGMNGGQRKVHLGPALSTPNFIALQNKNSNR